MQNLVNNLNIKATSEEDLKQILKLCTIYDQAIYGEIDTTVEDITNSWKGIDVSKSSYVVMNGEEIIGYGILTGNEGQFPSAVLIDPNYMNQGIEHVIWSKLEGRATELVGNASCLQGTIITQANNSYEEKLLGEAGFIPTRIWWGMGIELKKDIPSAIWPNGVTVRHYILGVDDERLHQAFNEAFADHWNSKSSTLEEFLQRTERAGFHPTLWSLAMVEGEVVGFVFSKKGADNKAEITHLGVRRSKRKQGLGLALLHHAFGQLYKEGISKVHLNVDSENITGAPRVYEAAGMEVQSKFVRFDKEVCAKDVYGM
ncbi:GNAT family N-acetyltransferase [Bacillus cereus group sp. BY32LC]|uniref:GNAT family N-acetyltransferase n=1 Tax=Bacillus cereus group sp. BY32LC TaxID=3018079 RepID=UPI0022E11DF8|nr:GNAT family N-acetyltransferase [Bacillus cereus group sp. BY32LC]MDA1804481.1 GNAT family N-acetyltransferase [Bacillus cereus group sp. BY32LC]